MCWPPHRPEEWSHVTSVAIGPTDQLDPRLLEHRRELTGYCYRMLGSAFDADDAVQETMVRAWRGLANFEGRSALRSWLYRIATNVCLDHLSGRQRRALPMDLSGSPWQPVEPSLAQRRPGTAWVEPVLDRQVIAEDADPAERAVARESIRLGFGPRAPAPAAAAARRPDPARGAAVEGRRGRRAARHDGRVGQQRAAAGARDARRQRRDAGAAGAGRRRPRAARPLRRLLRALRHRRDRPAPARGRDPAHAAVRDVAAWAAGHRHLDARAGGGLPRLAGDGDRGERQPGRRAVAADGGRRVRAVGAARPGGHRRPGRAHLELPEPGQRAVPTAGPAGRSRPAMSWARPGGPTA